MDDVKRDLNKSKRSRSESVKNSLQCYLQKRNYPLCGQLENTSISQQTTYFLVESEVGKPNSILYSCYNSDPVIIDHNFEKFLNWFKDLIKKNHCYDLENLVGPLFCHLYLDILEGGHSEKATQFFKTHLPAIEKIKSDDVISDLINAILTDNNITNLKEQFRSNKYILKLSHESIVILKKFVVESCHVVILHILQSWFDLQEVDDKDVDLQEEQMSVNYRDDKFEKLRHVIEELDKEPEQVLTINISNTKEHIDCALIKRSCGLIVFNQINTICLRPIHRYDSILGYSECQEIILADHSKQVHTISISSDNSKMVTGGADCTLCIYDLDEIKLRSVCKGHLGPILATTISSNNMYVASSSQDNTIRIWNITTGNTLRVFAGHTEAATCLDFHPNCIYLISGAADRNLRLWSIDDANPVRLLHGSKGAIYAAVINPQGYTLASASDDKKVRIWELLTSKILVEFKYIGEPITKLAWNKDGKLLCAGAIDGTVRIWHLTSIQENTDKLHEPIGTFNVNYAIFSLEYSFDKFVCLTAY